VTESATVSQRGGARWERGHPWIFKSDVRKRPSLPAGAVRVRDDRGRWLGVALWSPSSEISLRLLDKEPDAVIDAAWWHAKLAAAINRRAGLGDLTNGYRLVHAEGDGLPALICDRYDRWLVVQILSAGIEAFRDAILQSLIQLTGAEGVLARNDVPLRSRENLPRETVLLHGDVPRSSSSTNTAFVMRPRPGRDRRRARSWTSARTASC